MFSWKPFMTAIGMLIMTASLYSQDSDSAFYFTGIIYNKAFEPIAATHVINVNTQKGDVSDSLGIFTLPVQLGDTLWFRNIAFQETLAPVAGILEQRYIILKSVFYPLQEARIFPWGSSYEDFSEAIINTPAPQTLGESLGLPRQDPDYIPFDMDQSRLKSTGFLLTSPISFLYYNLSRKEKNRRKLFWNKKNQKSNERFDAIVSSENLSNITGLSGDQLVEFMSYLYQRMVCDYKCTELKIYSEIYAHWDVFQYLHPEISTK